MGPMRASRTPGTTHTGHLCPSSTWRPTREGHRTHDTVTDGLTKQATRRGASRLESPVRRQYGGRPTHPACLAAGTRSLDSGDLRLERLPCSHLWLTPGSQSHTRHPPGPTEPHDPQGPEPSTQQIHLDRTCTPGTRNPPSSASPVTPSRSRKPQQLSAHAHGRLSNSVHTRGADHWRSLPQGGGRRVHSSRLLLYSSDSASWPVHSLATICHSSDSASLEGSLTTAV